MLTISSLTTTYGAVKALDDVNLVAPTGQVTAILGANGAGKTTLLRSISGLVASARGSARFNDSELVGKRSDQLVRLGVSHVPEGRGVIAELTVEENLRLGGLFRRDAGTLRDDLSEMYEFFPPLSSRRNRATSTLSGGERQMLAIGRSLMARPSLLLLDEPSLGLAPLITAQIMAFISDMCRVRNLTVILVEQNAKSALSIATRAVVLSVGKVVIADTAENVASDDELRHHYLGF